MVLTVLCSSFCYSVTPFNRAVHIKFITVTYEIQIAMLLMVQIIMIIRYVIKLYDYIRTAYALEIFHIKIRYKVSCTYPNSDDLKFSVFCNLTYC